MILHDPDIIGKYWEPTGPVFDTGQEVLDKALEEAGVKQWELEGIGVTGYGRFLIGKKLNAKLIQEELTVNSKGAYGSQIGKRARRPSSISVAWITRPLPSGTVSRTTLPWAVYALAHQAGS